MSNANGGAGHTYVDSFTYTGQGLVSGYTLGNGATVSLGYGTNGRLQLSEIILAKNGTTLQKYQYSYGQVNTSTGVVDTTKNNGQLAQVDSWIGTTQEYRQQYFYDSVNRLTESKETYGTGLSSTAYDIKYRYGAFGNREQRYTDNSGNSTITQKWVESGDITKTNNRYTSGVTYDGAGNITADPRFRNLLYGYDANGRQNYSAQANGSSPVTTIFDGAGRRVATKASGYLSVMVYDAGGKLAAEYSQFSAPTTVNVDFITPNHQGSTSVITDNAGAVKSRHDYLPFGEEIGDGVGSRTTAKKFSQTDSVRHKYAGMETDDATGLNHTLWRKDDNWSGRWTSPDPYGGSMTTADPQSFNRYTYCGNDPVNHIDPSGLVYAGYHDATEGWDRVGGYFWDPTGVNRRINRNHSAGALNIQRGESRYDQQTAFSFGVVPFLRKHANENLDGATLRYDSTGFHLYSTSVTVAAIDAPSGRGASGSPVSAVVPRVGTVLLEGLTVDGVPDDLDQGNGVLRWMVSGRVKVLAGKGVKYSYKVGNDERQNGESNEEGYIFITATVLTDPRGGAAQSHEQPNLSGRVLTGVLSFDIDSGPSEDIKFEIGTYAAPLDVPGRTAFTNTAFLRTPGPAPFQFQPRPGHFGVYGRP